MHSLLPFLAAGAVGLFVLTRKQTGGSSSAPVGVAVPLRQGVRYLFIVRLSPGVSDEQARAVLEPKGVESLVFSPAVNPPFWAALPGAVELFSSRHASFATTMRGSSSITLGDPFYGIGRLEALSRLDGQPLSAEAPSA